MSFLLLLLPAALGVLQPIPSHLHIPSTSHPSTSNQLLAIPVSGASLACSAFYATANGCLVILPRETYPFAARCPEIVQIAYCIWDAHMGTLSSPIGSTASSVLTDVYTGTKVKPPKIRSSSDLEIYFGSLVAPLSTRSARLILFSKTSMFQWQVGAKSWSEHPLGLRGAGIMQIVIFKGQVFAMDFSERLHILQLEPLFSMQRVHDLCVKDLDVGLHDKPWLVACGDILLMVVLLVTSDQFYILSGTFQVFRLDFSDEPAKWVKVEKLENWALFVSKDRRTPTFSFMWPERWGGKSNNIYISSESEDSNETWTPVELGQAIPDSFVPYSFSSGGPSDDCTQLRSLWVFPNLVYGAGQ